MDFFPSFFCFGLVIGEWIFAGNVYSNMDTCKVVFLLHLFQALWSINQTRYIFTELRAIMSNLSNQYNTHSSSCKITGFVHRYRPYKQHQAFVSSRDLMLQPHCSPCSCWKFEVYVNCKKFLHCFMSTTNSCLASAFPQELKPCELVFYSTCLIKSVLLFFLFFCAPFPKGYHV